MRPEKSSAATKQGPGVKGEAEITVNTAPVNTRMLSQLSAWAQRGSWSDVSVEEQYPERHSLSQRPTGRTYYGIGFKDSHGERSAEMYHDPSNGSFMWRGKPIEDRLFG